MIDLHIHTKYSDGTYTVKEVLQEAEKLGLKYISITDHDNCKAYDEFENYNIEVRKIAVVEWIKKLYELNSSLDILDFLTKAEKMYSIAAENVDMES